MKLDQIEFYVPCPVVLTLTVTAVLVHKAIKDKLQCVFVDTGLMRKNEVESIKKLFIKNYNISLDVIDASKIFLKNSKVCRP